MGRLVLVNDNIDDVLDRLAPDGDDAPSDFLRKSLSCRESLARHKDRTRFSL